MLGIYLSNLVSPYVFIDVAYAITRELFYNHVHPIQPTVVHVNPMRPNYEGAIHLA